LAIQQEQDCQPALAARNNTKGLDNGRSTGSHGSAQIEIKQQKIAVRVEAVTDLAERERIFVLYQRDRARNFSRLFGVPVDAPPAELAQALAVRDFVKMTAVS
jgi:hypothetical protein